MVEQKNEITIWTWTCPNRHTFDDGIEWGNECPVCKGRAEANTKKKQVYYRKDKMIKELNILIETAEKNVEKYFKVDDGRYLYWDATLKSLQYVKENLLDGSLAPPVVIDGRGGSKHRNVGLKAETEKCNVIARETPSVSAENIKDEEKKDEVM